ncbi:7957b2b8-0da6-4405-9292-4084d34caf50 [Sclerotinia trifoliorum]|uniref:7957b2b8-0da6-4405-9292-4084d34caf50 n=1 Tax=Sclerotinia trifoliorum TaxID=28548 RepID=A0A8H2VY38_9HELO|nr:7957b2b8-0da6-4405-9292-4084d34caf50 [Sclerotinia trifoliorum]
MAPTKEILVIGGTGAQGIPVVKALAGSGRYTVRVLTRDINSPRAQELVALGNVTLIQGHQDNQKDLHKAFRGVYGAWVNTDGFTLGEKDELFYGFRAYEIARGEGVQHYVWANIEYGLKIANWDEDYHCGHMTSKARIGQFILAQGQEGMKTSLFTTGPYMDMLLGGLLVPIEDSDGTFVWANPSKDGKIPFIALQDVGVYNLWLFDNPSEAAGFDLSVVTDSVSFAEVAETFTKVTGKRGVHKYMTDEDYKKVAEPYPGAYVNWSLGPDVHRDESVMLWADNFAAWWRYWGEGVTPQRDLGILDRIHPNRIKSLEEWMKLVKYDGKRRNVLKMVEDWEVKVGAPYEPEKAAAQ